MNKLSFVTTTCVLSSAALIAGSTAAYSAPAGSDSVQSADQAVRNVAAHAPALPSGDSPRASAQLADSPSQAMKITSPGGSTTIALDGLTTQGLKVQGTADQKTFVPATGNAVVTSSKGDSARAQFVINSAKDAHSASFTVQGGKPMEDGAGGIAVVSNTRALIAEASKPWAVDAKGKSLPTEYKISGNTITQTVHADSSTAYPVVADPTFGWEGYFVPTVYLNKSEVKTAANTSDYAWICAAAGPGAILCGGNSAIISKGARAAAANNNCMKILLGGAVFTREFSCSK